MFLYFVGTDMVLASDIRKQNDANTEISGKIPQRYGFTGENAVCRLRFLRQEN